jgi:HEAT repeat protein
MQNAEWPGPRRSVEALGEELGRDAVINACVALVEGRDVDGRIIHALGGPPARWAVVGGEPGPDYWLRVWALRGLLWLWDDAATSTMVVALTDEAWRVREMAAKVAARHRINDAHAVLLTLRDDPSARVRASVARAIASIATTGR